MAKKEFNSIAELAKYIDQQAKKSLVEDVSKTVIKVAQEHVDSDVYGVYSPKEYSRTGELRDSFVADPTVDGVEIYNDREDVDLETGEIREIAEIIERGHDNSKQGYTFAFYYPNGDNYIQPRPFMENTRRELSISKEHVKSLKNSLKRKGFNME